MVKKEKKETLDNAEKNFYGKEMIINAFENIFRLPKEPQGRSEEQKQTNKKPTESSAKELNKLVNNKETDEQGIISKAFWL